MKLTSGAKIEEGQNNIDALDFFDGNLHMENVNIKAFLNLEKFLTLGFSLALFPITHEMNSVSEVLKQKTFKKQEYLADLSKIFDRYKKTIRLS